MLTTDVQTDAAELLAQGKAALKAGDKDGAMVALRQCLEIDPGQETAWIYLASLYHDMNSVAYCLQQALSINPTNDQVRRALEGVAQKLHAEQDGGAHVAPAGSGHEHANGAQHAPERTAQREQAAGAADLKQFPFEELKRRGIVAAKGGRREEARACLLAATEKNDADSETWYWLSTVVDDADDRQIALENVLVLDPLNEAAQLASSDNARALAEAKAQSGPLSPDVPDKAAPPPASEQIEAHDASLEASAPAPQQEPEVEATAAQAEAELTPLRSRLFVQPGTPSKTARPSVAALGDVIGGKYTVVSAAETASGMTYVVVDVAKKQFFSLKATRAEASDLRKSRAPFVSVEGVNYTIVSIGTENLTLRNLMGTVSAMPPRLAATYALTLLKDLAQEHARGPILTARKYVTPDTVAFDAAGNIILDPPEEHFAANMSDGYLKPFLPPEQAQGRGLAPTSDLFAVGALLFFMLTGSAPPSAYRVPRKQGDIIVPSRFEDYPDIPEDLGKVIAVSLQPSAGDRYASAGEMIDALRATEAGRGVKVGRSKLPAVLALSAVIVLAVAAAAFYFLVMRPADEQTKKAAAALVQPTPPPPTATTVPIPLARTLVNSVDTRRFPANTLFFSALDASGLPLRDLTTRMVAVKENGQDVSRFQLNLLSRTTDPVSIIVALDTGQSMAGKPMDDAKTALMLFSDLIQPGDQVALLTFGGGSRPAIGYTVARQQFLSAVVAAPVEGKSDPAQLIDQATALAKSQPQGGYTALVIVSNMAFAPSAFGQPDTVIQLAKTANLPVFFVGTDPAAFPKALLEKIATGTGGAAIVAPNGDAGGAAEAMRLVERQVHNTYKVAYESPLPDPGTPHEVEVTVTSGPLVVADKRNYVILQK